MEKKLTLLSAALLLGSHVDTQAAVPSDIRNYPYCEVIPMVVSGSTTTQTVFNTLGYNTCPRSVWKTITSNDVITAYNTQYQANATSAVLNGRRHWVMDQIIANGGNTTTGNTLTVNGLEFSERGVISGSGTEGSDPYTAGQISRSTTFVYKKGLPVFELTDSCGTVYTMQAYSTQVYPTLTYDKLKSTSFGKKLKLPVGWSYSVRRLSSELDLTAEGSTYVVQDIFADSYQINPAFSHTRSGCTPTTK